MKKLLKNKKLIVVGCLSMLSILPSIGMAAQQDIQCECRREIDEDCMPGDCPSGCVWEDGRCYMDPISCRGSVPEGAIGGLAKYGRHENPAHTTRTYVDVEPSINNLGVCEYTCDELHHRSGTSCLSNACKGNLSSLNGERNNNELPTKNNQLWFYDPDSNEACTYHCKDGYHYGGIESTGCTENECTGDRPNNSEPNNSTLPDEQTKDWKYASDGSTEACTYHCKDGYKYEGGLCKKIEVDCFFCNLKTSIIGNILTSSVWDMVMDKLDQVFKYDGENITVNYDPIPQGAIMAFKRSTCPTGRRRLDDADGRYLRGSISYGTTYGSPTETTHTLTIDELPPHSHYVVRNYQAGSSEAWLYSSTNSHANMTIAGEQSERGAESDYSLKVISSSTYPANAGKSSSVGSSSAFSIMDPYITVLYCVKD